MPNVLVIGAALVAILIILAGWVIMGHRREERSRVSMGAAKRPGTATELADEGTAGRETAVAPGPGDDPVEPDLDGSAPAEPEQAAEPQASGTTSPAPDSDGPRAEQDGPLAKANGPGTKPDAPRAAPNGHSAIGDVTVSDRIGSYYDEADRAMSDYLAAMGWTEEQETRSTG